MTEHAHVEDVKYDFEIHFIDLELTSGVCNQSSHALCSEGACTGELMLCEILVNVNLECVFSK